MGAAATKRGDRNIRRQIDQELEAKRDATEFTRVIEENYRLRQELAQARAAADAELRQARSLIERLRIYRLAAEDNARAAVAEAEAARAQAEANQAWRDQLLQDRTQELQEARLRIQKLSAYLRCCPADVVESAKIDARVYYPQLWPVKAVAA